MMSVTTPVFMKDNVRAFNRLRALSNSRNKSTPFLTLGHEVSWCILGFQSKHLFTN